MVIFSSFEQFYDIDEPAYCNKEWQV
jgi:hypothetical protein